MSERQAIPIPDNPAREPSVRKEPRRRNTNKSGSR